MKELWLPLLAVAADICIGDPRSRWHPVALLGTWIAWGERKLLRSRDSNCRKFWTGGLLTAVTVTGVYTVTAGFLYFLTQVQGWLAYTAEVLLLAFAITPRSLAAAGQEILALLEQGKKQEAQRAVAWIVGRDTAHMDEGEVTRATVETLAENLVDGIFSPLFYALLGGVPLACAYRAVNTLDSMLGYRNEKYMDFGCIAARLDDICNYIPARLTGLVICLSAWLLGYDAVNAMRSIWRDAGKHPSPNGGIPEAGVAGALGIRLGGQNYYGGISHFRAYMGEAKQPLVAGHIRQTIRILWVATGVWVLASTLFFLAFCDNC